MFSVTITGTCWRPLCTAIVKPTKSGVIVERRDQVLIGFLLRSDCAFSTFLARCKSTNGPFLTERGTVCASLLLAPIHDHAIGALVVARLVALGRRAPRADRMTATLGTTFAAAVRVIDRVHRRAAHGRPHPAQTVRTGLPKLRRLCSALPTSPIVARQSMCTLRTS